ncbi:MAG: hypothetical protein ACRD0A_04740 [Acidimicrobiales bacterium]
MTAEDEELAEFREALAHGVRDLLAGGYIQAAIDAVQAETTALEALGGTFAEYGDRLDNQVERIRDAAAQLGEAAAMEPAEGTSERWSANQLLVDLSNLHIDVDSSVARSSFARTACWALDGLADMHPARLMERIGPAFTDALDREWPSGPTHGRSAPASRRSMDCPFPTASTIAYCSTPVSWRRWKGTSPRHADSWKAWSPARTARTTSRSGPPSGSIFPPMA